VSPLAGVLDGSKILDKALLVYLDAAVPNMLEYRDLSGFDLGGLGMRLVITLSAILLTCSVSHSTTIHVPDDQPTIQAGINAASSGDTVLVANGTYSGPGNREIDFLGKAIVVRSASGDPELCIVDAAGDEPYSGFYFHSGEDSTSVLEGFTIMNGVGHHNFLFWSGPAGGGGVACNDAKPLLRDLVIRDNFTLGVGAGLDRA